MVGLAKSGPGSDISPADRFDFWSKMGGNLSCLCPREIDVWHDLAVTPINKKINKNKRALTQRNFTGPRSFCGLLTKRTAPASKLKLTHFITYLQTFLTFFLVYIFIFHWLKNKLKSPRSEKSQLRLFSVFVAAALSARKSPPEASSVGLSATGRASERLPFRSCSSSNDAWLSSVHVFPRCWLQVVQSAIHGSPDKYQHIGSDDCDGLQQVRVCAGSERAGCPFAPAGERHHSHPEEKQNQHCTLPPLEGSSSAVFISTCQRLVLRLQCCLWKPSVNSIFRVGVDANGVSKAPLRAGTHLPSIIIACPWILSFKLVFNMNQELDKFHSFTMNLSSWFRLNSDSFLKLLKEMSN